MADHQHLSKGRLVTDTGRHVSFRETSGKAVIDIYPAGATPPSGDDGKIIMSDAEWSALYTQAGLQLITIPIPDPTPPPSPPSGGIPTSGGNVVASLASFENGSYAPLVGSGQGPNTYNATLAFDASRHYDGVASMHAAYAGGGANAYARVLVNAGWQTGDHVFYGAGFFLPVGFKDAMQGEVSLIRWDNYLTYQSQGDVGGIVIWGSDKKARLKLGGYSLSAEQILVGPFDIPEGRWFWLEVEQKLSPTAGDALSTVYLDGQPIGSSTAPNTDGRRIDMLRYGLDAIAAGGQTNPLQLWFDRCTVSASRVGPV